MEAEVGHAVTSQTIYNLLYRYKWRKVIPDKQPPKNEPGKIEEFKKNFHRGPAIGFRRSQKRGWELRIMFQDEARFGRMPVIRRAWASMGTRPNVKAAVQREYNYVYGAISPFEGELD